MARTGFSKEEIQRVRDHNSVKGASKIQPKAGTAIYVSQDLTFNAADYVLTRENRASSCSIEIHTKNKTLHFTSAYYPRGMAATNTGQFKNFKESKDKSYIISGDFNDHAELWSALDKDVGKISKLSSSISDSELVVLNDLSHTRVPDISDHSPSAIDLTFVSPSLGEAHWSTISDKLFLSDHCPIFGVIFPNDSVSDSSNFIPTFIFEKADWNAFTESLSKEKFNSDENEINSLFSAFQSKIIETANNTIPKTKLSGSKFSSPWWNDKCQNAKYEVQLASRNYYASVTPENKTLLSEKNTIYKKAVASAKLEDWERTLRQDVHDYRDSAVLWRKVKKVRRGHIPPKKPIIFKGKSHISDKDRASALAEAISQKSRNEFLNPEELERRQKFEASFKDPTPDNDLSINDPITMAELEQAIKNIRNVNKASGSDPLNYLMLSHLPTNCKKALLNIYNKAFSTGQLPQSWKEAQVFSLLKPGKPASDPDSYRPISLTPHSGKLFEKIIQRRLEIYLDDNNLLPDCQNGFRHSRSTTDNLVYLTESMKKALRHKYQGMYCTFFDIQKAFDRVWHAKLLEKLSLLGLSGHIYNIIKDFLHNRKMQVRVNNELSEFYKLDMGSPQGAVLSPLLFIIMMHDIETKVTLDKNKIMLYADDIALISDIGNMRKSGVSTGDPLNTKLLNAHQNSINSLISYMSENGFSFSERKTQFQVVSNYAIPRQEAVIKVNKITIHHSPVITYLGLKFHCLLRWLPHFKAIKQKAIKYTNLLKILASKPWARGSKFLVDVARSLIRSVISYGQECFFAASKTELKFLDTIESIALRIVLGLPPNTPANNLYQEVGWLPLDEERRLRCSQFVIRTQRIVNNLVNPFLFDHKLRTHSANDRLSLKTKGQHNIVGKTVTLWEFTSPTLASANIALENIEKKEVPPIDPQHEPMFLNVNKYSKFTEADKKDRILIHHTLEPGTKKSDHPLLAGTSANEYIELNFYNHFQIYTDGSVQSNLDSGIGVVWKDPNAPFSKDTMRANSRRGKCTTSVELEAIGSALGLIADKRHPKNVILTDSLSSLQALQNKPNNNYGIQNIIRENLAFLSKEGISVEFCHVPSHCGVIGNEFADLEANRGSRMTEEINPLFNQISRTEGYRLIREAAKKDIVHYPTLSNPNFSKKRIFPSCVSQYSIIIYRRLKLKNPWFNFINKCSGVSTKCPHCDSDFEISHLTINACQHLRNEIGFIHTTLASNNLSIHSLLDNTSPNNWSDALYMCEVFRKSTIGHLL